MISRVYEKDMLGSVYFPIPTESFDFLSYISTSHLNDFSLCENSHNCHYQIAIIIIALLSFLRGKYPPIDLLTPSYNILINFFKCVMYFAYCVAKISPRQQIQIINCAIEVLTKHSCSFVIIFLHSSILFQQNVIRDWCNFV